VNSTSQSNATHNRGFASSRV